MPIRRDIPVGRRILAVAVMAVFAVIYMKMTGSGYSSLSIKKINPGDVQEVTVFVGDKSHTVKDAAKIKKLVELYNNAKALSFYKGPLDPAITVYIKMPNADIYIAAYKNQQVVIQYKSKFRNRQYLSKAPELAVLLNKI